MNSEKYIGLDVHQATIVVAVMDSTGKLWNPSSSRWEKLGGGGTDDKTVKPLDPA